MKKILLSIATIAVIVGCGSSDVSGEAQEGQVEDSVISNLDYNTGSYKGVTNKKGYFKYDEKDSKVVFKVGKLEIGSFELKKIKSDKKVLPADILGLDRNNTTDKNLMKMIRVLQSLDKDNNVSNGIQIEDSIKDKITKEIESNTTYKKNIEENNITVLKNLFKNINKKFVLEKDARAHYENTLKGLGIKPEFAPFITSWEVQKDNNITFLTRNMFTYLHYDYNYTVDWGDGNISKDVNVTITHQYDKDGNYTVKIIGKFPFFIIKEPNELRAVEQWGDIHWRSFKWSFLKTKNFEINATDTPDLSETYSLGYMFFLSSMNQPIDDWDVSNVGDMESMFYRSEFNQSINDWNVSNVTHMNTMFAISKFNQPLDKWNVSNVVDMSWMFAESEFNQNINDWDVSHVEDMGSMFEGSKFNQPLDKWDVSHVDNMGGMFDNSVFNQNINDWNVSNVTNMNMMFLNSSFNQPLDKWDVSNVKNMREMFKKSEFNQNINDWDVSNVTNMNGMFFMSTFNQPLDKWNTGNVENMFQMFRHTPFNQPINNWDVHNVIKMKLMFADTDKFNQPLDKWDTSKVEDMSYMFYNAKAFHDQDLSGWNVDNVISHTDFMTGAGTGNKEPKWK